MKRVCSFALALFLSVPVLAGVIQDPGKQPPPPPPPGTTSTTQTTTSSLLTDTVLWLLSMIQK